MLRILILLLFVGITSLYSADIYVNSTSGNDNEYDGSTPSKAFKTINKAISNVQYGDNIIVEGLDKEKKLEYKEHISINPSIPFFILKGNNYPVILPTNSGSNSCGILVLNSDIRIEGIEFKNFAEGEISYLKYNGGAGIVIQNGNRDAVINNCKFTNCNYGIIANENQSIRINGNKFDGIKKNGSNKKDGGIAILMISNGAYQQDNSIGAELGNEFNNIDNYGILLGNETKLILMENSKIQNNKFLNSKGTGLGLFNVEGIFNITGNTFDKCNTSIELMGSSIDAIINNNTFKGATGNYELLSDEIYPGELLFGIWKGVANEFPQNLMAISEDKTNQSIKSIDGKRFVTSKLELIEKNKKTEDNIIK